MIRALAITVSNRAAAGVYEDRSGPVLVELLRAAGCDAVSGPLVVPDGEPVLAALRGAKHIAKPHQATGGVRQNRGKMQWGAFLAG